MALYPLTLILQSEFLCQAGRLNILLIIASFCTALICSNTKGCCVEKRRSESRLRLFPLCRVKVNIVGMGLRLFVVLERGSSPLLRLSLAFHLERGRGERENDGQSNDICRPVFNNSHNTALRVRADRNPHLNLLNLMQLNSITFYHSKDLFQLKNQMPQGLNRLMWLTMQHKLLWLSVCVCTSLMYYFVYVCTLCACTDACV